MPRLLVLELWGLGDLALAMPFLRSATEHTTVTLLAKPQAAPLVARFAPGVEHIALTMPWTAFSGKYLLHRWPWRELTGMLRLLRHRHFDLGVSARRDPRDHLLLTLAGVKRRFGFALKGSRLLLTDAVSQPARPHRAEFWQALARALELPLVSSMPPPRRGGRIVIHRGAGHPVRIWPRERFAALADRLRAAGWDVDLLDENEQNLETLLDRLAAADRFIGNDSGPGHVAALLGVPTFTVFGPQLPELFAPQHPQAAWIEGSPCPYKPCFDYCRFPVPFCIRDITLDTVWASVQRWLETMKVSDRATSQ